MSWSEEDFFAAFSDAGMLSDAVYQPAAGDPVPVSVGFSQPDALLLNEMVKITQYQIEYETAAMPALQDGETITIGATAYTVTGTPEKKGDGYFSTAEVLKS